MMTAEYWIALAVTEVFTMAMATMAFEGEKRKMIKYAAVMIGTAILYTLICVAYGVI